MLVIQSLPDYKKIDDYKNSSNSFFHANDLCDCGSFLSNILILLSFCMGGYTPQCILKYIKIQVEMDKNLM